MAFEWWCYSDPANAVGKITQRIEYDRNKALRKAYRAETGCKSCARYMAALNICSEGKMPNISVDGGPKWCKFWWDHRSSKPAPEIE